MTKPSTHLKMSGYTKTRRDDAPVLIVIKAVIKTSDEPNGYQIYRLKKQSRHSDRLVAMNLRESFKQFLKHGR